MYKIYILIYFLTGIYGEKITCKIDEIVELEADTIYYIETLNFPNLMEDDVRNNCTIQFKKNFSSVEYNKRFIFSPTNYKCAGPYQCNNKYIIIENMETYTLDLSQYYAVQGFALFDDWGYDCPLESVARVNPYHFEDETQILNVQSGYGSAYARTHPCLWQFSAPKNYGFKIVFTGLHFSDSMNVIIDNSNETVLTKTKIQKLYPYHYYVRDNYLKILLTGQQISPEIIELSFHLMIVKLNWTEIEANCTVQNENDAIIWSGTSLPNNGRCIYDYVIPSKTEIYVEYFINIEYEVDALNVYFDGNDSIPIPLSIVAINTPASVSLYPFENGTERPVFFEFKSDGSWQSFNFQVKLQQKECICNNNSIKVVPCNGSFSFNLMMTDEDDYYCGNLQCNFTIQADPSCNASPNNIILFMYLTDFNLELSWIFDVFRIISNNITQYEINYLNRAKAIHSVMVSPVNEIIFQAITVPSFIPRDLTIKTSIFTPPPNSTKNFLTKENPYFLYSLCDDMNYFSVELSPELKSQNDEIVIHISDISVLDITFFFKNGILTDENQLKECFSSISNDILECKTLKSEVIIFRTNACIRVTEILFQASSLVSTCVFKNNVFDKTTSAISTENGPCTIFFLFNRIHPFSFNNDLTLKNLGTTSTSNGTMKIYAGTEIEEITSIDLKTVSLWSIPLIASIYIFEIPKSSSVIFYIEDTYWQTIDNALNLTSRSVAISPNYGMKLFPSSSTSLNILRYTYNLTNFVSAKFTLQTFEKYGDEECYFLDKNNNKTINVSSELKSIKFSDTIVQLVMTCHVQKTISEFYCAGIFNVRFFVEVLLPYDNDTTTTSAATLSSTTKATTTKMLAPVSNTTIFNSSKLRFVEVHLYLLIIVVNYW